MCVEFELLLNAEYQKGEPSYVQARESGQIMGHISLVSLHLGPNGYYF